MYDLIKKCIIRGIGDFVKGQTYYNTKLQALADICDMTKNLSVNCIGAVDDKNSFNTCSVRKDYYLIYMLKGSMKIEFEDKKTTMAEGDLLVLKPGTRYSYVGEKDSGVNYLWLHFTGCEVEKYLEEFCIKLNTLYRVGYSGKILDCWQKMYREFIGNDEHFTKVSNALLVEILAVFSRLMNNKKTDRLTKSILYIHENYHKKINISELADMENLSESHYRALFVENYSKTPVDYINERRIDGVVYLLENTDKPLDEIAVLTGFCDAYYMGKKFKKITGVTPGKYRRQK